jgi:hypothetical protein
MQISKFFVTLGFKNLCKLENTYLIAIRQEVRPKFLQSAYN